MQQWLATRFDDVLDQIGVDGRARTAALDHVQRRYEQLGWDKDRYGDAGFKDLLGGEKLRLVGLGSHVAHITERDVRHWSQGLPVKTTGGRQ